MQDDRPAAEYDLVVGYSSIPRSLGAPEWRTGVDGDRYLCTTGPWERYSPLEDEPALNAELADVEPTEQSIADFVARFGPLGIARRFTEPGGASWDGEALSDWMLILAAYKHIWGDVNGKPEVGQVELSEWNAEIGSDGRAWQHYQWRLGAVELSPLDLTLGRDDPVAGDSWPTEALFYLPCHDERGLPVLGIGGSVAVPRTADENLNQGRARDRAFMRALDPALRHGIGASLRVDRDASGLSVFFEPKTLFAVACLQMAQVLEGAENPQYAKCRTCGRMYRPSKRNPEQKGCGDARCRSQRFADNRDTAYRLSHEGKTSQAIADLMTQDLGEQVSEERVERWIRAAEKRKGKRITRGD